MALLLGPVVAAALLWVTLAAPFRAHGDAAAGGGARDVGLRAEATRRGDRARVEIAGRVPAGRGPVVVRVLGMRDAAAPCPAPEVARSGRVAVPAGGERVGWERLSGRVPGSPLRAGARFAMAGTVALPGPGAARLCVHLLRAGDRPTVLRTARPVVPSRAGLTPPSVVLRPVVRELVVPAARILGVVVGVVLLLAIAVAGGRRFRLVRAARPAADPSPAIVPPPWATGDLPALPSGVLVPDALPWPGDGDLFAGLGPAAEDPFAGPRRGEGAGADGTDGGSPTRSPTVATPGRAADAPHAVADAVAATPGGSAATPGGPAPQPHPAPTDLGAVAARYPAVRALRDRRAPGRTGPALDHLLIGPSGVLVARSRGWAGTVRIAEDRLFVRGLERTRAVDLVSGDVSTVRSALAGAGLGAIPVAGVLLHDRPATPGFDGTLRVRDVVLLDAPGAMLRAVDGGVLGRDAVARVAEALDRALPPA